MMIWQLYPGQTVLILREDAQVLMQIFEAFDALPFVWRINGGYQFVLLPRNLWTVQQA